MDCFCKMNFIIPLFSFTMLKLSFYFLRSNWNEFDYWFIFLDVCVLRHTLKTLIWKCYKWYKKRLRLQTCIKWEREEGRWWDKKICCVRLKSIQQLRHYSTMFCCLMVMLHYCLAAALHIYTDSIWELTEFERVTSLFNIYYLCISIINVFFFFSKYETIIQ